MGGARPHGVILDRVQLVKGLLNVQGWVDALEDFWGSSARGSCLPSARPNLHAHFVDFKHSMGQDAWSGRESEEQCRGGS